MQYRQIVNSMTAMLTNEAVDWRPDGALNTYLDSIEIYYTCPECAAETVLAPDVIGCGTCGAPLPLVMVVQDQDIALN